MQFRASDLPNFSGSISVYDFAVLVLLSALLWHPGKLKSFPYYSGQHTRTNTPACLSLFLTHVFLERNALSTLTFTEVNLNSNKIEWQNLAEKLTKKKNNLRKVHFCLGSERKATF